MNSITVYCPDCMNPITLNKRGFIIKKWSGAYCSAAGCDGYFDPEGKDRSMQVECPSCGKEQLYDQLEEGVQLCTFCGAELKPGCFIWC